MNSSEEELMEEVLGTVHPTHASPAGIVAGGVASALASEAAPSRNIVPAPEMIDSLPMQKLLGMRHRLYGGFWHTEFILKGMAAARTCFNPNPSDIFLSSLPKSGTTWLTALAFATLNRATHSPSDLQHPLRHQNPHDCVPFLEFMIMRDDDGATLPSPRLIYTHLAYSQLPHGITEKGSRCKIVYVCREPKDVLVSYWNFINKTATTFATATSDDRESAQGPMSFEETFEHFCEGRFSGGPHWIHVLEYWHESQRRPSEVLFLRYEDMLRDPEANVKKLASFMGCAFLEEEEEAGVAHQIVELCSLENLKSLDVNKNGTTLMGVKNEAFFRKGQVGDWKNYMTVDMAARLDKIVEEATRGSGLTFGD